MKTLMLLITLIGYNGDDYQRPDVRQRRIERQEEQRWKSDKWQKQQEQYKGWLNERRL
jgi:hypothetical protein